MPTLFDDVPSVQEKRCCTCRRALPYSLFCANRGTVDGRNKVCRDCASTAAKRRSKSGYYRRNYQKNRDKIVAAAQAYYFSNREKVSAYQKKHYQENADRERAASRAWGKANRERKQQSLDEWHRKNPGKQREYWERHYAKHAKKYAVAASRRRALKVSRAAGIQDAVEAFYRAVKSAPFLTCCYCGQVIPEKQKEVDHRIPLVRGGWHAIWNLACACRFCNRSKATKTDIEFCPPRTDQSFA